MRYVTSFLNNDPSVDKGQQETKNGENREGQHGRIPPAPKWYPCDCCGGKIESRATAFAWTSRFDGQKRFLCAACMKIGEKP